MDELEEVNFRAMASSITHQRQMENVGPVVVITGDGVKTVEVVGHSLMNIPNCLMMNSTMNDFVCWSTVVVHFPYRFLHHECAVHAAVASTLSVHELYTWSTRSYLVHYA